MNEIFLDHKFQILNIVHKNVYLTTYGDKFSKEELFRTFFLRCIINNMIHYAYTYIKTSV